MDDGRLAAHYLSAPWHCPITRCLWLHCVGKQWSPMSGLAQFCQQSALLFPTIHTGRLGSTVLRVVLLQCFSCQFSGAAPVFPRWAFIKIAIAPRSKPALCIAHLEPNRMSRPQSMYFKEIVWTDQRIQQYYCNCAQSSSVWHLDTVFIRKPLLVLQGPSRVIL